jgi:hypothetical protein
VTTDTHTWDSGQAPWVRRELINEQGRTRCLFCGGDTAKLSYLDHDADYGRVELYCDNPDCDASTVVVLVRQGGWAAKRADVRALDAVDKYAPEAESTPEPDVYDGGDDYYQSTSELHHKEVWHRRWQAVNESDSATRRRLSEESFTLHVR